VARSFTTEFTEDVDEARTTLDELVADGKISEGYAKQLHQLLDQVEKRDAKALKERDKEAEAKARAAEDQIVKDFTDNPNISKKTKDFFATLPLELKLQMYSNAAMDEDMATTLIEEYGLTEADIQSMAETTKTIIEC